MWLPAFVCPDCQTAIAAAGSAAYDCPSCARSYGPTNGVWRFLAEARRRQLDPFARQYREIRGREGRRATSSEYYRMLPSVAADDPHAGDWKVRRETYRHLLRHVLAGGRQPSAILDLGAGSGWLSHRLATLGHHVVAVDALEDDADGLGAVRHYPTEIVAIHADFDALPLAPAQFDVVIFNGSLHYAPDASSSLAGARRMLAAGGTLVVMDSPMFRADRDGAAMVAQARRRFADDFGVADAVCPGAGYLTFASLAASANALRMEAEFVPSRGPLGWRVRRQLARIRLGRQPAAFGLWVAR
jgi:SAM-dependent methyltransferase